MKRLPSITGRLLGLLALGALAVTLALTFEGLGRGAAPASFQSPIETPTWPPYPLPITPAPTGPPTIPVSPCTFGGRPAPAEPRPSLEAYQFFEPRVVLTHTTAIGIAGWLPDGQHLLITRLIPPALVSEYVDILNTTTGALQHFGERHGFDAKPVWLASEQAVAFSDLAGQEMVLRIHRGEGVPVIQTVGGLTTPHLAVSPDGRHVVFLSGEAERQPQIFDVSLAQRQTLPLTLPWVAPQDLLALGQQEGPIPYQASWYPEGTRIAFYNDTGFYLVDMVTAQLCEINLGSHADGKRWAVDAQWSPDGRYLAALTTIGDPIVRFVDLTLVDMHTGEYHSLDLGHQHLSALAWAPNGRHLVVLAEANRSDLAKANQYELYLVDATSGDSRQMLAEHLFMFSGAYGIAWSPTGQDIAIACPTIEPANSTIAEGRLCIISVEVRR